MSISGCDFHLSKPVSPHKDTLPTNGGLCRRRESQGSVSSAGSLDLVSHHPFPSPRPRPVSLHSAAAARCGWLSLGISGGAGSSNVKVQLKDLPLCLQSFGPDSVILNPTESKRNAWKLGACYTVTTRLCLDSTIPGSVPTGGLPGSWHPQPTAAPTCSELSQPCSYMLELVGAPHELRSAGVWSVWETLTLPGTTAQWKWARSV